MDVKNKAASIDLFSLKTPQMRAFHMSWFAFFLCFFAWFGIAPMMKTIREEMSLNDEQVANLFIASVTVTILARLFIGWLCDRIGPRLSYTFLLIVGSIPVMSVGLATDYESLWWFRLSIGMIGASFVITQYHTSVMFAPNCVGTANATSAGWGNMGGGATQIIMPLVFAGFVAFGLSYADSWRMAMLSAGVVCFLTGIAYFFLTTDLPNGNFKELRASGELVAKKKEKGGFWLAIKDYRVWALFAIYAACFGVELTINGMAALYYADYFDLGMTTAGLVAGLFGLMNIFARTLGGFISDRFVRTGGLRGRVKWLFIALLIEGFALIFFSQMRVLALAIPAMIVFSLFVQMSEGATYSIVPFINKKALGPVAGIVGAGGNMGAVAAGFLLAAHPGNHPHALLILGGIVAGCSCFALAVRFSEADEKEAAKEFDKAYAKHREEVRNRVPVHDLIPGLRHLRPMDALRIYLGVALMIKGVYFIMDMGQLEATLGADLGEGQMMVAWSVVFAHVIGGAALVLGFVTRLAAAANALILLGATIVSATKAVGVDSLFITDVNFQFTALIFFTLILFGWRGAGPLSVDHLIRIDAVTEPEIEF